MVVVTTPDNYPELFHLPSPSDPHAEAALLARAQGAVDTLAGLLTPLASLFQERGESLYLVGGPVRDAMLGRLGHDLDFTTSARPEVIAEILGAWGEKTWDTGIEFGTVSAVKRGQQVEITTFRSDLYDGVTRNPEVTFGDSLDGDLVRRDFACNAMAIELSLVDGALTPRSTTPSAGSPTSSTGASIPRGPRRCRSATTRCACCVRPGSSPSWVSPSPTAYARR